MSHHVPPSTSPAPHNKNQPPSLPFKFPPPIRKPTHWSRSTYWHHRHKQLSAQAPQARTTLFRGIVVYFTGVRCGQRKLEHLIWRNGGRVVKLWLRREVTHVIADNLAASKVEKEIKARPMERMLVVRPEWVKECVTRGAMVGTEAFRVVEAPPGVRDLTKFFGKKKKIAAK